MHPGVATQSAARPVLRPGVHVVARGRDRLQIGLADGLCRVVPDDPVTRAALALLQPGATRPEAAGRAAEVDDLLGDLRRAGLTEDDAAGPHRLAGRAAIRVEVRGTLGPSARSMLAELGVAACPSDGPDEGCPDAVLVLSPGELDRALLDPLVRAQVPHLPVRAFDGQVVLGPFVQPGRTACLACLDAHRADEDPEHPAVVERYVRAGDSGPIDPALATVATAWAVRDLVTWADGGTPSSWSTTLTFGRDLADLTSVSWLRHPSCGCSWPD